MNHHMVEEQREETRNLAEELLHQSERCALAGLQEQAAAILTQVWTITEHKMPDLANVAAWEAIWLQLRMGSYEEAAAWLGRVDALPIRKSLLWPTAKEALMCLCRGVTNTSSYPAAAAPLPVIVPPTSSHHTSTTTLPELQIKTLGRFQIVRDGHMLPTCKARKPIAILRYLLSCRHHAAQKDELMELVWPDADLSAAAHSLHVAVNTLRRYLDPCGASYLLHESGRYFINPNASVKVDHLIFEQLSSHAERCWREGNLPQAQQAYIAALEHYHGDYYVDKYDLTWAIAERERLLMSYLSVLDHLGRIFMAQNLYEPAVQCYQRLLERDSYREDAHLQLMRSYYQLGRRSEALGQYERCRKILEQDLGLKPMRVLQELYQTILTSDEEG